MYLEELERLAGKFEEDEILVDDQMALLFRAGSSAGGARPKVLLKDGGHGFLVKCASHKDRFDVVALEDRLARLTISQP